MNDTRPKENQPETDQCGTPHGAMLQASTFINNLKQEKRYTEERLIIINMKLNLLEGNPYLQEMANQLFMH